MKLSKLYKQEQRIGKKSKKRRKKSKNQLPLSRRVLSLDQLYEEVRFHNNLKELLRVKKLRTSSTPSN